MTEGRGVEGLNSSAISLINAQMSLNGAYNYLPFYSLALYTKPHAKTVKTKKGTTHEHPNNQSLFVILAVILLAIDWSLLAIQGTRSLIFLDNA